MTSTILTELGAWSWIVLGMILLAAEIFLPGVYLLWIGIAAVLTGALSLQLWEFGFWTWHAQTVFFLALALASAYIGSRFVSLHDTASDEPLLNRRSEQLIGRTAVLNEPITEGRGRIQLGDTLWLVQGPDLPVGARVRVTSVKDSELIVEAS